MEYIARFCNLLLIFFLFILLGTMAQNDEHDSNLLTSSNEMVGRMLIVNTIANQYKFQIPKHSCYTFSLIGHEYILELLNGHPDRMPYSFRMDKNTFRTLCEKLR